MSKHALQAMGGSLRAELAVHGVDVCLLNPGPFATGFNDAMANEPGEWFTGVGAPEQEMLASLRRLITEDQLDPAQVVTTMADLAEAETTELQNLVPPDIFERIGAGGG
jgi:NAD(P)-dependent dehydrogenase (short-subunit alcohol dehydrogenase family)